MLNLKPALKAICGYWLVCSFLLSSGLATAEPIRFRVGVTLHPLYLYELERTLIEQYPESFLAGLLRSKEAKKEIHDGLEYFVVSNVDATAFSFITRWLMDGEMPPVPNDIRQTLAKDAEFLGYDTLRISLGYCPHGYIPSPVGFGKRQTRQFCVAEKLARRGRDQVLAVTNDSEPWSAVNLQTAERACEANGEGFKLMSNDQWLAITTDVIFNPENWNYEQGPVGEGPFPMGRSPRSKEKKKAGRNSPVVGDLESWLARTDLHLSNGFAIQELIGHKWQWLRTQANLKVENKKGWYPVSQGAKYTGFPQLVYPDGLSKLSEEAAQYFGNIFLTTDAKRTGILRGGDSEMAKSYSGVLSLLSGQDPESAYGNFGFRCVYEFPDPNRK